MKTPSSPPEKINVTFEGEAREIKNNEDVLPPTIKASRRETERVCGGVETYNKRSLCVKYRNQGVQTSFTSPPLLRESPWEIRSPQGQDEIQGMREQISLMLQKNAITEVPPDSPGFCSNVFLVCKASGGWHPVIDLKRLNTHIYAPHFRMFTISLALGTIRKG